MKWFAIILLAICILCQQVKINKLDRFDGTMTRSLGVMTQIIEVLIYKTRNVR